MSGFVYFIGASGDGNDQVWVKIGFTTGNVYARRDALQTGCPYPLDVLAYAPGTIDDEKFLHKRFKAFRGYGEWFEVDGFLQAYLADLIARSQPMKPADKLWTEVWAAEHRHEH